MENRISRISRPIVDESALPNVNSVPQPNVVYANSPNIIQTLQILDVTQSQTAPASIQTATTPITANNPVGALATLATLGIITAGAGAISMTATALAKKKEQDEAKSAQMAKLQSQQSAQAQSASANWAENQDKQTNAQQTIFSQVTQSQANIEHQNAFLNWQKKVFIAMLVALALSLSVGYTPDRICDEGLANTDNNPSYEPCGGSSSPSGGGGGGNARSQQSSNVSSQVINETTSARGNITSRYVLTQNQALDLGIQWLGNNYYMVGKGVYRSNIPNIDGTFNQFRIDNTSILGRHNPFRPHVHLEVVIPGVRVPVINNHVLIME